MNYSPLDEQTLKLCKRMKVKKTLAGGLIKEGTVVYTLHKFRIYVPKPGSGEKPTEAAGFEMDVSLFDDYFEPVPEK